LRITRVPAAVSPGIPLFWGRKGPLFFFPPLSYNEEKKKRKEPS